VLVEADRVRPGTAEHLASLPGLTVLDLDLPAALVVAREASWGLPTRGTPPNRQRNGPTAPTSHTPLSAKGRTHMYICYIRDMSEPVVESMAEVRSHLADVIDRAHRDETPTIITRRGRQEAVVIDIEEYQRLRRIAEDAEEAWLNRLADEAESEGTEGSVSLEEMAALLRDSEA
jgi:prevent-host-death family protein